MPVPVPRVKTVAPVTVVMVTSSALAPWRLQDLAVKLVRPKRFARSVCVYVCVFGEGGGYGWGVSVCVCVWGGGVVLMFLHPITLEERSYWAVQ